MSFLSKLFSKKVVESKVVKFNLLMLLTTIVSFASKVSDGFLSNFIPDQYLWILAGVSFVGSWLINTVWPSGVLIGSGANWKIGRYVAAIGAPLIFFLQEPELAKLLPAETMAFITATLVPVLQTIVRVFGGASPNQVKAAAKE